MCSDPLTPPPLDKSADADDQRLQAAARLLVEAIAAEPVPERLRELAMELGKALDQRQRESKVGDAAPLL